MKTILLAALAAGAAFTAVAPVQARQGCGFGAHHGPGGRCRPDRGGAIVAPGVRIGVFYPGRGYWSGRGYYRHRYRWHGGWRYR